MYFFWRNFYFKRLQYQTIILKRFTNFKYIEIDYKTIFYKFFFDFHEFPWWSLVKELKKIINKGLLAGYMNNMVKYQINNLKLLLKRINLTKLFRLMLKIKCKNKF